MWVGSVRSSEWRGGAEDSSFNLKNYKAHLNPNAHTPSSHVIQSEAKPKRGIPDGRKWQIFMSFWAERQRSPENPDEAALLYFTLRWIPRQARNDEKG